MQQLCVWVKGRSISVPYIYIYIYATAIPLVQQSVCQYNHQPIHAITRLHSTSSYPYNHGTTNLLKYLMKRNVYTMLSASDFLLLLFYSFLFLSCWGDVQWQPIPWLLCEFRLWLCELLCGYVNSDVVMWIPVGVMWIPVVVMWIPVWLCEFRCGYVNSGCSYVNSGVVMWIPIGIMWIPAVVMCG